MGLLNWLTGAAKRSAKSGGRSTQTKKKRQKKQQEQKPKQQARSSGGSKPSQSRQSSRSGPSRSSGGSSYKPKTYHGTNKTATTQSNVFQPRTFKPSASKTQTRYAQFKASNVAPKAYKATATAPNDKKDKKPTPVRGAITKATVAPTPRSGSRFDLPKDYDYKKDLKQAAKKGSTTTTLGTQQKKETITLKSKKEQKKEYKEQKNDYYKSNNWKSTKADLKTYNQQRWRKALSDQGMSRKEIDDWMNSEEGMKHRRETYNQMKAATKKNINKSIAKDIKETSKLETVNAHTRGDFSKMVTAQSLGKDLGDKYLKSVGGDKLLEKIGSKNAASSYKGKFITGALQGSGPADVINSSVGKYNKAAKEANKQTKESGAYMAGYVGGQMAGFGLSKTNAIGKGLTETLFKATAKNTGRQIARNAAMSAAAESPMNMLDAVKMATDENGKINKKALAGYMALNTGLSGGMSAGTEGIAAAFTKKNANKLVSLQAKASTGRLTKEEGQELKDLYAKLDKTRKDVASSGAVIADDAYTAGKQMAADARIARGKAKSDARMAAAQAENTARQNAKVDKAVEQSKSTMQSAKNQRYNDGLSSYLKRLEESRNERGLMRGNEEAIENSASGGIVKGAPDSTKIPEGVKTNKNTAKSARKAARDELGAAFSSTPAKYSKAEAKEIDDTVDRISNMLAHGNEADARAEARQIARKYGNVDKQFEEPNLHVAEQKKVYADARHTIHGISFRMPEGSGQTIDKWLEDLGTTKKELGQKVKIRKGTGTGRTYSIDEVWDELCEDYPGLFSKEVTNPNDRFAAVIDVALKKADDIPESQLVDILPEDIEKMYDDLADRVFAQAESNVKGMKGEIPGRAASADFEAATPKADVEAPKETAGEAPQGEKPNPAEPYRADAEERMRQAKTQRENEKVDAYVEKLKSGETEPPATPKPEEPKAEPKPGDAKNDLKPLDNMGEADLDKEIRGQEVHLKNAINKYGEDAPRVKEIQEHIDAAKKQKEEVRKAKDEAIQETPGYARFTEDELAPDDPAWSISVRDESTPTEPVKGDAIKKADKGGNAIMPKSGKMASLRRLFVNSLAGFEDLAKQAKNNKMLGQINNVQHWRNKMASWIEGERSGMDRKVSGEGLNTIFDKQGLFGKKNIEKRNDFVNYLTYKHAIDRMDYDKPVHMDVDGGSRYSMDDYIQMIGDIEDKYRSRGELKQLETFEKDIRGYFDDLLKMRVDSGLISKEFADDLMEKYPNYIPTLREGDEWLENGMQGGGKQTFGVDDQIKAATGGSGQILDLYQSAAQITRDVIRDAEQNELLRQYAETLGIKDPSKVKQNDLLELPSFAASVSRDNNNYRVSFFQDGEMVTMPVDKQIAKGLREINGQDYQRLLKWSGKLSGAMRLFKAPITDYNLIFGVRNGARDIQQAAVNSKSLKHFSTNVPTAQISIMRKMTGTKDPWMRSYEANGGMYSTFFQQDKKIVEPGAKKGIAKGFDATAGKGLRAIEAANSAIEATPRLAEYIGTIKKDVDAQLRKQGSSLKEFKENLKKEMYGAGKELTEEQEDRFADEYAKRILEMASTETIENAARNAADITLNFSRNGVIGKALNAGFVPYFNPSVQGLSKTVRMFTENKAEGMKALMNFGMKLGVLTIAPSALNEIMNSDNRDYQNLATREKDANFFIPIGDGKFIKIPKPRENSVLAEPVVYGLRYFLEKASVGEITPPVRIPTNLNLSGDITKDGAIMEGEYSQWKDLGQLFLSARENIGPVDPFKDNLVSPIIRLAQNKTWYGGSIESVGEVVGKKEGEIKNSDIYDDTTSATALWIANQKIGGKKVSDIAHMSPKKIDDFMDSYFGIVYDLGISQTSDRAKAERTLQNNPVAAQFIKDSVFSNKNGTELWAEFDKANAPDTLGGKLKQKAKDAVLGHSALNINEKSQEAKDWLNQKGYDDMTYSTALSTIRGDDSLSQKQKENISRNWKKAQNDLRRDLVYGSKEVSWKKDPLKTIAKSVGVDKAMNDYTYTYVDPETGEKKNQHLDAWNAYKKLPEYKADNKKGGEKFIDFYSKMRWTNGRIGESKSYPSWMTASILAATEKGKNDDLAKAYIRPNGYDENGNMTDKADPEYQEKIIQRGKNYKNDGWTQAYYRKSQKTIFDGSRELGYEYKNEMNPWDEAMSLANDKAKYKDGAYYSADTSGKVSRRMNYARGLNEKGHDKKEIYDFAKEYDLKLPKTTGLDKADRGKAWAAFDAKVEAAVKEKYGDQPREVQALVYHVITDDSYHKPFGDVGDYSLEGDTGITDLDARDNSGWGGRGRRGWHRRGGWGHGGGGGGGGAAFNPEVNKAGGAAKQTITKAKVSSPFTSNTSKKSNLDEAYRKRAKKLREAQKKAYKS